MSTSTFAVTGMTCKSCSGLLTDMIGKMESVASVDVSLEENKATVTYKGAADDEAVIALITKCKFGATKC